MLTGSSSSLYLYLTPPSDAGGFKGAAASASMAMQSKAAPNKTKTRMVIFRPSNGQRTACPVISQ
jgi:hypothetical protein